MVHVTIFLCLAGLNKKRRKYFYIQKRSILSIRNLKGVGRLSNLDRSVFQKDAIQMLHILKDGKFQLKTFSHATKTS